MSSPPRVGVVGLVHDACVKAACIVLLIAACSAPPAGTRESQSVSPPAAQPIADARCGQACAHAVGVQLAHVEEGHYARVGELRANRDKYVTACSARCNFDVDCVLGAPRLVPMLSCRRRTKDGPHAFLEVIGDVYPVEEFIAARRKRYDIFVPSWGSPAPTLEAPEGMLSRLDDGWNLAASTGYWPSPISFNVKSEWHATTLDGLRGLYARSPDERELTASENSGRSTLTTIDRDGVTITTLVYVPVKSGYGLRCRGDAMRIPGFADEAAIARMLEEICASIRW